MAEPAGGAGPAAPAALAAPRAPAARRSPAPTPNARERRPSATWTPGPAAVATQRRPPLAAASMRERRSARRATRARRPECASAASRTATARRPAPICNLSTGTCQACSDSTRVRDQGRDQARLRDDRDRHLDEGNVRRLPHGQPMRDAPNADLQPGHRNLRGMRRRGCDRVRDEGSTKPVCVKTASGSLAKGTCVACLVNSDCSGAPTTPICKGRTAASPAALTRTAAGWVRNLHEGRPLRDGRRNDLRQVRHVGLHRLALDSANAGTSAQPFCSMEPVTDVSPGA